MRTIRPLTASEVDTLVDWAALEGWNPGIGDAAAFRAADPEGFLGAFVDGAMLAGISAVAYGQSFGFIGLYICRPEFRGKGHGKAVWDAGMARLAGRTVGLDGVPEQQSNYAAMGFAKAYETVRLTGVFPSPGGKDAAVPLSPDLLTQVRMIDARCFPAPRAAFIDRWLTLPRQTLVVVEGGRVRGFGSVRRCKEGHKVGPLFAEKPETAQVLLGSLAKLAAGPVAIDVPASQTAFSKALIGVGFTPGFSTARMYRGPAPAIATDMVFGVTTLELG